MAGKLSLRVQQLDVRVETKTLDNVFVRVMARLLFCRSSHTFMCISALFRLCANAPRLPLCP